MKLLLRIIGYTVGLVVLLVIAGLTALFIFVDPNDYKDEISTQVKTHTGRDLTLSGDIGWSFFPRLGFEVNAAELSNDPDFAAPYFAKFDTAEISIAVGPLLQKNIVIDRLGLKGLSVNLETNAAGNTNWETLTAKEKKTAEEETAKAENGQAKEKKESGDLNLNIHTVDIQNAEIVWKNAQANQHYELDNFNLQSRDLQFEKPFPIQVDFDLTDLNTQTQVSMDIDTQVSVLMDEEHYVLDGLKLDTVITGPDIPNGKVTSSIRGDVDANLGITPQQVLADNLTLTLDDATMTGFVHITDLENKGIHFDLAVDSLNLDRYTGAGGGAKDGSTATASSGGGDIPVEMIRKMNIDGQFKMQQLQVANAKLQNIFLKLTADKGLVNLAPVTASLYEGDFKGDIALDARPAVPTLKVNSELTNVNLEPLLIDMTDKALMTGHLNAHANLTAQGKNNDAMLQTLDGNLDVAIQDGEINIINIGHYLTLAETIINSAQRGALTLPEPSEQTTDFAKFSATATIDNGLLSNDDLILYSSRLRAEGKGTIDIPKSLIDYKIDAAFVRTGLEEEIEPLHVLSDVTVVPITAKGDLADPKISINVPELLLNAGMVNEQLEKYIPDVVPEEAKEAIEKGVKGIKGIFGK